MITDTGLYDTGTCEKSQGGRLYARVVSLQLSTITNRERYMVNMAKDYFVSVGCTFIYGDTDSSCLYARVVCMHTVR